MKIIITGSTGFIGRAVLLRCLQHPDVTSVVAITRRPVRETDLDFSSITTSPPSSESIKRKLQNVILKDFEHYTPEVLSACQGAEACIWTLGNVSQDPASARKVNMDYLIAGAKAMVEHVVPTVPSSGDGKKKFRFILTSGVLAETDQEANLWFMGWFRRLAGQRQHLLTSLSSQNPHTFQAYIIRPGLVYRDHINWLYSLLWHGLGFLASPSGFTVIGLQEVSAAAVQLGIHGDHHEGKGEEKTYAVYENEDLIKIGRAVLASS